MKSRICFNFAAIVALVLAVAAIPSHATERRDPLIVVDSQQAQSARNAHHATHAKASQKKPGAKNTQQQNASDKSSNVSSSFEAKDQLGAEVSSGSSKSARTSAGK